MDWFKSYHDENGDPKVSRLSDFEYRVWRTCLNYCSMSPSELRRQGMLYHSKGFPVDATDFARLFGRSVDEVEAALQNIASVGGDASLIVYEDGIIRIRNWRKRQEGRKETEAHCQVLDETLPEPCQNSAEKLRDFDAIDKDKDLRLRERSKTKTTTEKEASAGDAPGVTCSFCKPLPETPTEIQALVKTCHDIDVQIRGRHPTLREGIWFGALNPLLKQHGAARVEAVFRHFMGTADSWLIQQGRKITDFASRFDGIAEALDDGRQHGTTRSGSGTGDKRHQAAPREDWKGAGGRVSL